MSFRYSLTWDPFVEAWTVKSTVDQIVMQCRQESWNEKEVQRYIEHFRPEQEQIVRQFRSVAERCACSCSAVVDTVQTGPRPNGYITVAVEGRVHLNFPDQATMDSFVTLMALDHGAVCDNSDQLLKHKEHD